MTTSEEKWGQDASVWASGIGIDTLNGIDKEIITKWQHWDDGRWSLALQRYPPYCSCHSVRVRSTKSKASLSSDICAHSTPSDMADREDNVYRAKLAEQAERYDGESPLSCVSL